MTVAELRIGAREFLSLFVLKLILLAVAAIVSVAYVPQYSVALSIILLAAIGTAALVMFRRRYLDTHPEVRSISEALEQIEYD